jgi:dihydroflavonol-4-reductase
MALSTQNVNSLDWSYPVALAEPQSGNVLVTGATGFIGCNLAGALVARGYSVSCLVRRSSDTTALRRLPVRLVTGGIDEPDALREAVQGMHTVYHLAGLTKASGREQYFHINQIGTRLLLEAIADVNPGLCRFVHMSSLAAAGPSTGRRGLVEGESANPISWYGESKLGSEEEVLSYSGRFSVAILRPSAVYGPGDRDILLVFQMIKRGCLFTPGRFVRRFSLIHVDDLVDATILAGKTDMDSGEIFFVSRPEIYEWEEVGRAIARALGVDYRHVAFPRWIAEALGVAGDLWSRATGRPIAINGQKVKELLQPAWICDTSKARARLGFNPKTDLDSGVRKTAKWYKSRGWL